MEDLALDQGKTQGAQETVSHETESQMAAQDTEKSEETPAVSYSKAELKEALEAKDQAKISGMLNSITAKDATEIVADADLMGLIETQTKEVSNAVYDKIYTGATDAETMCSLIKKRFGIAMGSKNSSDEEAIKWANKLFDGDEHEVDWTLHGAMRIYGLFLKLPESHLKSLKIVATSNTLNGGYGGAAYSKEGVYYMDYAEETCDTYIDKSEMYHGDLQEDGSKVINEEDANYGLNYFDSTAAHELGHVVDYSQSTRFSDRPEYMKMTGWKKYDRFKETDRLEIIKDAREYLNKADPDAFADKPEISGIVDKIGMNMIENKVNDTSKIEGLVNDIVFADKNVIEETTESTLKLDEAEARMAEIKEYWNTHGYKYESQEIEDEYWSLYFKVEKKKAMNEATSDSEKFIKDNSLDEQKFVDTLKTAPLLEHLARANVKNDPWFHGEPYSDMPTRQIHADYNGVYWYSYNVSARANKISNYQFCNPAEEFAELYASYMAADANTRKTPEPLKSWFEENVLPLKPPQAVTDAASQGSASSAIATTESPAAGTTGTVAAESSTSSDSKSKKSKNKKWWQLWK